MHNFVRIISNRLPIKLRAVPLAHHLEIGAALAVRRAALPAVAVQKVRGRGEHVRSTMPQIDMAVAVEIDAVLDVARRQKLRLPDLPRIGADQVAKRQVAALHDLQRCDQLALE